MIHKSLTTRIRTAIEELQSIEREAIALGLDELKELQGCIITITCDHFKVKSEDLFIPHRRPESRQHEYAFMIICALLSKYCDYRQERIAGIVKRERSSVSKAIKKFNILSDKTEREKWLKGEALKIEQKITEAIEGKVSCESIK